MTKTARIKADGRNLKASILADTRARIDRFSGYSPVGIFRVSLPLLMVATK
jgi:hypothetical protein